MAANSYGTRGNPVFSDSGAPDTAVDPSLAAQYGSIVGNRIVGTSTQRAAFSGIWAGFSGGPWDGLEFYETDTNLVYLRVSGAWVVRYDDTGWTAPTLLNSWVNLGSGYAATRYRRINRIVYIEGTVASGTTTDGTVMFAVPAGFRPASAKQFAVAISGGAGRVEVQAAGNVVARTVNSGATSFNFSYPAEA